MNRSIRIAVALAALAIPVSMSAATLAEPVSGFTQGMNIEWNERHLATFAASEHRAFHAKWEAKEREWLTDHQKDEPGFNAERRMWTQERNVEHRAFHRMDRIEMPKGKLTFMVPTPEMPEMIRVTSITPLPTAVTAMMNMDVKIPARHYTLRMSRRTLRIETEKRIAKERMSRSVIAPIDNK